MLFQKGNVVKQTSSKSKAEQLLAQGYRFVSPGSPADEETRNEAGLPGDGDVPPPEDADNRDGSPLADWVSKPETILRNADIKAEIPPPDVDTQTQNPQPAKAAGKGSKAKPD